jgi:hypothetical protein
VFGEEVGQVLMEISACQDVGAVSVAGLEVVEAGLRENECRSSAQTDYDL